MSHSRISAGLDGFRLAQERQGVDEPVDTVGKQTAIVDTHMKPGEDRDIQRHRTRQPRVHLLFRLAPARQKPVASISIVGSPEPRSSVRSVSARLTGTAGA